MGEVEDRLHASEFEIVPFERVNGREMIVGVSVKESRLRACRPRGYFSLLTREIL